MKLQCPVCQAGMGELDSLNPQGAACPQCGFALASSDGILRALAPDRRAFFSRFLRDYGTIRKAEGRGSSDRAYYLALPFQDLSGRNSGQWRIRAATYRYFESKLLPERCCDVLDIGAGNGWMSNRLSLRGHRPVAVDIFTDPLDGLGAAREFGSFPCVEAEFDRLPFAGGQFDLAVFNSSLHYSTDYHGTLAEARRCLRPGGRIVVLDSPLYKRREHGEKMRGERHRQFQAQYGFPSDSVPSLEYLYESQLDGLSRDLGLRWRILQPWYGWKWHLRPLKARLQGKRPPSRFCVLVASAATS
ncbi:MAG TPA: class I SAM-dependent methyltransferase [Bryobacteraceae bacterium]|jgi:SAM-dependent methyltransferase|nr:class I SAM-dependent methyltransferase [Bryobacteraceae bacterium]